MIESFRNHATEDIFNGVNSKAARNLCPENLWKVARRKLQMVNVATNLNDLRIPPSNFLEPLIGDRSGQFSIRINDQYRVCFIWDKANNVSKYVEIVDYH